MNTFFIQHNENTFPVAYSYTTGGHVKVYSVPALYSEDGYCVTMWRDKDPEVIPACASHATKLLAHVACNRIFGNESFSFTTVFAATGTGVTHAQN